MLREQRKQFAGHVGREVGDAAAAQLDPFAVRAGQHEPAVTVAEHLRAEQLRLFAAHHVDAAVGGR